MTFQSMDLDALGARSGTVALHGYPGVGHNLLNSGNFIGLEKVAKDNNQLDDIESRATVLYKAGEAPPNLSKKQSKRNKILLDLQE